MLTFKALQPFPDEIEVYKNGIKTIIKYVDLKYFRVLKTEQNQQICCQDNYKNSYMNFKKTE